MNYSVLNYTYKYKYLYTYVYISGGSLTNFLHSFSHNTLKTLLSNIHDDEREPSHLINIEMSDDDTLYNINSIDISYKKKIDSIKSYLSNIYSMQQINMYNENLCIEMNNLNDSVNTLSDKVVDYQSGLKSSIQSLFRSFRRSRNSV